MRIWEPEVIMGWMLIIGILVLVMGGIMTGCSVHWWIKNT